MLIDMALMRGLAIDLERGVVRVQPGLTWGEVTDALQEHGLAVPAGDTASVGVGGLTLGGGIGWLVRKLGLTIDSLISADVVTADGRLLRVSADEHPDLFWGLRGGGGNFGIVTSFEFRTHPVGMVLGGALIFDGREARTVLRRYADVAAAAPEELSTITHLMPAPPLPFIPAHLHGKPVVILMLVYAGDIEEGQAVVNELRAIGTPVADLVNPMPYAAIYALTQEGTRRGLHHHVRSTFMRSLDDDVIDTIAEYGEQATSPISILQIRILGGAMGRVDESATAFRHREAQVMLTAINAWEGNEGAERHRAWTERFYEAVRSHESGVYVNFLADEGDGRIREAYGDETYDRLVSLKTRYDPSNLFHLNQNIRPRL
jgi:FAD/FMN-containing dehydrogenase